MIVTGTQLDGACVANLHACTFLGGIRRHYNLLIMDNKQIARVLRETAQLLEIDGAIIGRYRSYEKAAELIDGLPESIEQLVKEPEKLKELPGIGERMAEHLQEIVKTGDYALRKRLLKKYPATILDLLQLQSLGPKKVAFLWSNFKAATVADVEKLAREEKLRDLPGFGEKSEQNILKAVEVFKKSTGRFHINTAEDAAAAVTAHIKKAGKAVESVTPAGSLRRGKETVGDLDLLVTLADGHTSQKHVDALAQHILAFPGIDQTLAHGENKVSFTLANGLQVDVRMLEKENFGAALLYFTGSKEHNVALRGRANDMGYTLNEYALSTLKGEKRVAGRTEEEIYAKLKLDYIPPELRENTGEIAAAEKHRLPHLVVVVGSVHSYSNLDRAAMTERLLAAIETPYTQIIAHPTGRLLLRRDPFDYDMEKILDAAAAHGVAMECNSYPDRLDLKDVYLRMCKDRGVKVVISTDSHNTANLGFIRYGVTMARRGWLEKADVLNTVPFEKFLEKLRPKPGSARHKRAASR